MKLKIILILFICKSINAQNFDPVNPDYDLLKSLVIEKVNKKRVKKNKSVIIINEGLQVTAESYVAMYSSSKLQKSSYNNLRVGKKIKLYCKANGYDNAFMNYDIASVNCMNFGNSKFYYDKEDEDSSTHLFQGNKPTKKERLDPSFKKNEVKLYSYNELAELLVKQFINDEGNFKILNNGYDKYGFALSVERRTLYKNKIPKIKLILIMGGNRITW